MDITLAGKIKVFNFEWNSGFRVLALIQSNELIINVGSRLEEVYQFVSYKKEHCITFKYYISKEELTEEECIERKLEELYGGIDAENRVSEGCPTCGLDYDATLKIGGHDLFKLFEKHEG